MGYMLVLQGILGALFARFLGHLAWSICHNKILSKESGCGYQENQKLFRYGEIGLAALFILATGYFGVTWELLLVLIFICILYVIALTDFYAQIILDSCIFAAIAVKIIYFFAFEEVSLSSCFQLFGNGMLIAVPILIFTLFMEFLLKKDAFGGGDIKFLFVLGMYLGWEKSFQTLFLACIMSIVYIVKNRKSEENSTAFAAVSFGPFLSMGAVIVLFL